QWRIAMSVRLTGTFTPQRSMCLDGLQKIACPPVMQKENALPDSPKRFGAEHIALRQTLGNVTGQPDAHVVDQQIGIKISLLVFERLRLISRSHHHHSCVAKEAADSRIAATGPKQLLAALRAGRERYELGQRQLFHEDRKGEPVRDWMQGIVKSRVT